MIIILTLLLAGCGTTNIEKYSLAAQCGDGDECQTLWDDWNRSEERRMYRERKRAFMSQCGEQVLVCRESADNCFRRQERGLKMRCSCECISKNQINRLFQ